MNSSADAVPQSLGRSLEPGEAVVRAGVCVPRHRLLSLGSVLTVLVVLLAPTATTVVGSAPGTARNQAAVVCIGVMAILAAGMVGAWLWEARRPGDPGMVWAITNRRVIRFSPHSGKMGFRTLETIGSIRVLIISRGVGTIYMDGGKGRGAIQALPLVWRPMEAAEAIARAAGIRESSIAILHRDRLQLVLGVAMLCLATVSVGFAVLGAAHQQPHVPPTPRFVSLPMMLALAMCRMEVQAAVLVSMLFLIHCLCVTRYVSHEGLRKAYMGSAVILLLTLAYASFQAHSSTWLLTRGSVTTAKLIETSGYYRSIPKALYSYHGSLRKMVYFARDAFPIDTVLFASTDPDRAAVLSRIPGAPVVESDGRIHPRSPWLPVLGLVMPTALMASAIVLHRRRHTVLMPPPAAIGQTERYG